MVSLTGRSSIGTTTNQAAYPRIALDCLLSFVVPSLRDASQRHPANSVATPADLAFEASDRNATCVPKSGHELSKKTKRELRCGFLSTRIVARNG